MRLTNQLHAQPDNFGFQFAHACQQGSDSGMSMKATADPALSSCAPM
jgi:hypothetical protein